MILNRFQRSGSLKKHVLTGILVLIGQNSVYPFSFDLEGQLSGWAVVKPGESFDSQLGLRYIPELSLEQSIFENYLLDAEISLNVYGTAFFQCPEDTETDGAIDPYRIWVRFSSDRFEARLGLQKITFGSATLLRPLRWFDLIDPRDPLKLTDGVYGLLVRYYFQNNANIWAWGLYGNEDPKGWEVIPTDRKKMEYGGRLQVPLLSGDIAASYHHRVADLRNLDTGFAVSGMETLPEDRIGLDGKWDIGIGVWFEGALSHKDTDIPLLKYQRLLNLGLDYTFGLGNGLYALGEYFSISSADCAFGSGEGASFTGLSMNYPFGVIDCLNGMIFYDWDHHDWYNYINWQRTYDRWALNFIGFWNPERLELYQDLEGDNLFAGKGIQVLFVFNH